LSTGNYPYLKIYFDGGSRGNPGPSAVGVVIYDDKDKKIEESGEFIGEYTNNIAEYSALKKALELAKKYDCKKIMLFTDSKLLNNQIQKIWKIKDPAILKMYVEISRELAGYDVVDIRLIPRSKNSEADKLVNKALDKKELTYDGESKINFGKLSD
jgi:ribonuclease HI